MGQYRGQRIGGFQVEVCTKCGCSYHPDAQHTCDEIELFKCPRCGVWGKDGQRCLCGQEVRRVPRV